MRVAKHGLEVSRPSHDETPKGDVGSHSHKMTTQPSGSGLNILDPEDTRQSGSAETTRSRIASPARVRQNACGHAADDDNQVTSGAADVPSQTHFGSPCDDSKRHALLASGSDDLTAPHEGNEVEHHSPSSLQIGTEPRTRTGVSDRDVADLLGTLNRKHRKRSRRVCTCCDGGSTCRVTFAPATELVIGGGGAKPNCSSPACDPGPLVNTPTEICSRPLFTPHHLGGRFGDPTIFREDTAEHRS